MTEILLQHEIDRLLDAIDGELTTRSRVVDALLDLRLAGQENLVFVSALDKALTEVPGRSTVTNEWWMARLGELRDILGTAHAAAH